MEQDVTNPSPPAPPYRKGWLRRLKKRATGVIITLGRVRPLARFGYAVYGAFSKRKLARRGNVPNMAVLDGTLMRGGQPREAGFAWLKAQGVDTILNLRREARWEEKAAKRHGLRYYFLEMPVFDAPPLELVYEFLRIATNPENGTVFFHCYHGADRTGTLAAVYRVAVQGWSLEDALEEFYRHGFHAGYQDRNLDFLYRFTTHWYELDEPARLKLLNR